MMEVAALVSLAGSALSLTSNALGTFNNATTAARNLRTKMKKFDPETQEEITILGDNYAEAKMALVDLKEAVVAIRDQLLLVQKREELTGARTLRDGAYHLATPPAGCSPGPYCVACWDVRDKQVPLRKASGSHERDRWTLVCPSCHEGCGEPSSDYSGFFEANVATIGPVRPPPRLGDLFPGSRPIF